MNDTDNTELTEKLLDRIRKLYAMSKQTEASPRESVIALARCDSLMKKYGVTEADLETSDFSTTEAHSIMRKMPKHVGILGAAVGVFHDCTVIRDYEKSTLVFQGFTVDAEIAPITLQYLLDSLERSLSVAKRDGTVEAGRSPAHDYRVGFAAEIYTRCKEIDKARRVNEDDAGTSTGTSLVVRKMALVKEHFYDPQIGKAPKIKIRQSEALQEGRKAGSKVSLNTQVEQTPKASALLG